ncbi:SCO4225 family membrane protein [Streptomyces iconiensis]|uniref:Integral membrane protein n=1 Tax=Streptomyces iconiensis TaxID=1384038 RepID=A0ABT6ZS18_9ACTN|nr:hypothetical protein [Streptomyces iconiensis]MDJ1131850.1 hypothetical protein [Streptomyces iconiensis]
MSTAHKEPTAMTDSASSRPAQRFGRFLRRALSTVLARVYLAVCAGLLIWALVESSRDTADASLAGVWPLIATAPVSMIMIVLPDDVSMFVIPVIIGALVNAVLIGWCASALRQGWQTGRGGSGPTA